jgi:Kef-type K+ transport system membrane component KefB/nucleotide-binding universal stress UspA family protein
VSEHDILLSLLALAVILLVGRGTAEVARRLGQPEVLGELLGGFLLGPSVVGSLLPGLHRTLFLGPGVAGPLSLFSWTGAILLLLIAGLEADLDILREKVRPGGLAAAGAILPSLVAGSGFAYFVLGKPSPACFFLGLVLSVTAVSVAAKLLIEHGALRRSYAQVILAAGIATEVVVWPLISVLSAVRTGSPVLAGLRSALFAVLFFALMLTVGRRFTFWAMRRVADLTYLVNGQLSLVLVLAFLSAAATQALGLHALLGAFTFGVVLSKAPRTSLPLKENVQALAVGLFAPVFFVLAGMRIDIFKLGSFSAVGTVLLLFAVATGVKAGIGALGARLGGLGGWEALLVGAGVNLKGGTDVIVAILGVELGLLSEEGYTAYAVVAVLTVLVSPPLLRMMERRAPPTPAEMDRLNREEARRRAYLTGVERVPVPVLPELLPAAVAGAVQAIARVKQEEGQIFDITELVLSGDGQAPAAPPAEVTEARESLSAAGELERVELTRQPVSEADPLRAVIAAAQGHTLMAIGARAPEARPALSLGRLQDRLLTGVESDVLVAVGADGPPAEVKRILVPVNGLEYSLAAADVAAYLAKAHDAELVLFTVMHARLDALFWKEGEHRQLEEAGYRILREARFRVDRLDVRCRERVQLGDDPGQEVVKELGRRPYQLVVLGSVDRSTHARLHLGKAVETVLMRGRVPAVLLVSHGQVV